MTNIFSLSSINHNPKRPHFVNNFMLNGKAKQKVVWYEIKNAIDPLTNEKYGHCKYKIYYINNKYHSSCLINMKEGLIGDMKTGERFYKLLVNYLDEQKFKTIFNLS